MKLWFQGERSTGYGVALLNVLFGKFSASKLLKNACPLDREREENGDAGDEQNKSKKKRTEWKTEKNYAHNNKEENGMRIGEEITHTQNLEKDGIRNEKIQKLKRKTSKAGLF